MIGMYLKALQIQPLTLYMAMNDKRQVSERTVVLVSETTVLKKECAQTQLWRCITYSATSVVTHQKKMRKDD